MFSCHLYSFSLPLVFDLSVCVMKHQINAFEDEKITRKDVY